MILVGMGTQIGARLRGYCAKKLCEKGGGEFFTRQYHGRTIDYAKIPFGDGQQTYTQIRKNGFVLLERAKGENSRWGFKATGAAVFKLLSGGFKL